MNKPFSMRGFFFHIEFNTLNDINNNKLAEENASNENIATTINR